MNMLSTPIARIRKGTTSADIIEFLKPNNDDNPIALVIDKITKKIPQIPNKNPECTTEGNNPIATETYKNIIQ